MRLTITVMMLLIGLASSSLAQGNLQFDQVVTVRDVSETVPVGKVWKVESYQQSSVVAYRSSFANNCSDLQKLRPYYIDGNIYYDIGSITQVTPQSNNGTVWMVPENKFPVWLKEGQTAKTTCSVDFLSIIEFNVVQ
jgi:hypothetical protein